MAAKLLILAAEKNGEAAKELFAGASRHHSIERAALLLSVPGAGQYPRAVSENEFIWDAAAAGGFYPGFNAAPQIMGSFRWLLASLKPDAVYVRLDPVFNYALLEVMRAYDPALPIYLALEDYQPICAASPYMLYGDGAPCLGASPGRCSACTGAPPMDIYLRKRRYQHFLALASGIFTPSGFMQNLYFDWGVAPEKLFTAPNCLAKLPVRYVRENKRNYGGYVYFGQVAPQSGMQRALGALANLNADLQAKIRIDIYGDMKDQPEVFQQEVLAHIARLKNPGSVRWLAPVGKEGMTLALAEMDWLLLPSLWGEGQPLSLRLARQLQRPVIAAGHAGFGEFVAHDKDGALCGGQSPVRTWEEAFYLTAGNEKFWNRLSRDIEPEDPMVALDLNLRLMDLLEDAWAL